MDAFDARVQRLFVAALAVEAGARGRWVREAARGDAALAAEVLSLLEHHEGAGGFLEELCPAGPVLELEEPLAGRYRLVRRIGSGGMGTVYLAEQLMPVRRLVALKVVQHGLASTEAVQRFAAEQRAIALMEHDHIARIFDSGTTADGRPFFAMEYVSGQPLTDYCAQHGLSLERRLQLLAAVARAVQHAHQKGIIHRDLKPSNILVTEQDGEPVPKVIDFGVAKTIVEDAGHRVTRHGEMVGTLEYMSPEQARGSERGVDTRADIYSLGVLLYELVTGGLPAPIAAARCKGLGDLRSRRRRARRSSPVPAPRPIPGCATSSPPAPAGRGASSTGSCCGRWRRRLRGATRRRRSWPRTSGASWPRNP
jgi:serine/threonine protein kinase